jgi:hypothetical protein
MPAFSLSAAPPPPQPSLLGGALSSGFHEALGNIGGTAEALGTQFESPGLTDWGRQLAASQRKAAVEAGRPDLEANPWSLSGMAYQVAKALPVLGGAIGSGLAGGAIGSLAGPEGTAIGAGAGLGLFNLPQAVGENVEAARAANNGAPLSSENAGKSLLLGVPEAAAMSVLPGAVKGIIEKPIEGWIGKRALVGAAKLAAYQAPLSAAQTAVTQQAFTPDMPVADRARQIVESALSGGFQGAVFGGVTSAMRRAPGVTDRPTAEVTTGDLNTATASMLQLPPPEKMTPLAKAVGTPYASMETPELVDLAKGFADRTDRTASENVTHGLLQEEIARRTMPGLPPGEGELFTPEQMQARAPEIATTKALAFRIAGGGEDNTFFTNFNAASEPELVNAIAARVDGKKPSEVPVWLKNLADKYAVPVGPKGIDPAERLVQLHEQETLALANRDKAVASGKVQAIRAANGAVLDLAPKVAEARRLLDLHDAAAKLLEPPQLEVQGPPELQGPPREPVPTVLDATGQFNLPGLGEKPLESPAVSANAETAPVPGQRELLTSKETGEAQQAHQAAADQFRERVLSQMPKQAWRQVEPELRSMDATSEPELIGALRNRLADADANSQGRLSAGLKALTSKYGLTDDTGATADLNADRDAKQAQHDDLLDRARASKDDEVRTQLISRATELRNTELKLHNDLLEWHAQADELGSAPPAREIPDRVPPALAKPWSLMQTIKESEGVKPEIVKAADNAQKAIEMNMPTARQIANRAQQMFTKSVRPSVTTQREGLSFREDTQHALQPKLGAVEGGGNAVQEPGPEGVDVRQPAENGGAVAGGHPEGNVPAVESVKPKVEPKVEPKAVPEVQALLKELGSNLESPAPPITVRGSKKPPLPAALPPEQARAKLQSLVAKLKPKDPRTPAQTLAERALATTGPIERRRDAWVAAENTLAKTKSFPQKVRDFLRNEEGSVTIPEMGPALENVVGKLDALRSGVSEIVGRARSTPTWLRKQALIWESLDGIVRIAGDNLKSARAWADTHTQRQAISDIKNKADVRGAASYFALSPEVQKLVDQHVAMLQNSAGLDSRKPWAAHTELQDLPNRAALEQRHAEMTADLSRLRQKGGFQAMQDHLQTMQTKRYQALTAMLQGVGEDWAGRGVQFEGHGQNPDHVYQFRSDLHDDPAGTNKFYRSAAQTLRNGIKNYIQNQEAAAAEFMESDPKRYRKMTGDLTTLKGFLRMVDAGLTQAASGTYSPLSHGRGEYFVAAKLATGEDERPVPAATQALQAALDRAKFESGVFHDEASNTVLMRVANRGQLDRLTSVFKELEDAGHLSDIKSGYPDNLNTMGELGPKYMKAMAEAVRSAMLGLDEDVDPAVRDEIQAQMMSRWADMLPDHSVQKYLQPRKFKSGFDANMVTAGLEAAKNISRSSTFTSMQGQIAKAREAMRQEVQDAKSDNTSEKRFIAQDVANELLLREAQAARANPATIFDSAQAVMHSLRIGFNPPYVLTMMSQIPTLLHPELAKKYGYARSAQAIGGVTGRTFKIIKAVLASPDWATVGFREDALRKAGISERDIKTLMRLDNAGGLSNNTYTTAMTDLGEGANPNKVRYKNWANAMGLYAEMLPRIAGALAAGDLYDKRPVAGMSREDYVHNVVTNSQFNWGPGQSSRVTSKSGPLGAFSRISLAFMQFQTKMVEKLYTEAHDLFSKDSSPELRKEAGTFLAGHLVAMTAIAGTLGLPAASFLAGLVDKLAAAFTGRDDIDTIGLYRTWMAKTFGPDAADVLAKGLPRALGLDFSHLGDQNLLPGTGIMVDKRKWEDASKDWFKSMAGSAFGEIGDLVLGARDIANGDYLRGAIKMMPEGVKGIAEGVYLSKHGYVDKNGNRYPIQPGARDILAASIGIDPANLAQYEEADRIKSGLTAQRQYREQNISSHLVRSIMEPGSADTGYWMQQALQYEVEHPGMGGPLESLQNDLTRFITKGATAGAFNLPLGVKPLDFGLQRATGFITPQR